MIELYYWPTPNSRKISIMLEELGIDYKIIYINIEKDKQFNKKFKDISPSNKVPAIIDRENNIKLFESVAILIYLAKKYKKFLPTKYYWDIIQWIIFQSSQVGPYLGQAHQFLFYNPGKSRYAEEKYLKYTERIYQTLDDRLSQNEFLVKEYSIADIATWPWIARHERHKIKLDCYPNILRWYKKILKRPAVIKGYNPQGGNEEIPLL